MVVSGSQGPIAVLAYDAASRLTSVTRKITNLRPSTITSNPSYDNANRLTTITYSSSVAGALATYTYSYDVASQLTQYTGPEGTLTYTYDAAGELTAVGGARSENYSYDLNGNRTMSGYTTGTGNRLTGDGTYTYSYDNEGNLVSKTRLSDSEQWTYTWDYRDRLTQVVEKNSSGTTITNDVFTLDVENRRIGKSTNGTQTWFAYDGQNTFADFNSGGSLTNRYLYGNAIDQLFAKYASSTASWYLSDMLGSVRQLSNTSGTVLDTLTYDSFGNVLSESSPSNGDRFKFTGREWDSEIALQFNRARYYNPAAGRWISEDPIKFDGDAPNLFAYVHNRPDEAVDPSGLTDSAGGLSRAVELGRPIPLPPPPGGSSGVTLGRPIPLRQPIIPPMPSGPPTVTIELGPPRVSVSKDPPVIWLYGQPPYSPGGPVGGTSDAGGDPGAPPPGYKNPKGHWYYILPVGVGVLIKIPRPGK
jgi:RHS repeat-associated protein